VKFNDAVSGVLCILLGLLLFYLTKDFPGMPGQNYGPRLFPRLIGVALMASGLLLTVKGVRERVQVPWARPLEWVASPRLVANFAIVVAVVVFYILASDDLGFLPTAFASMLVMLVWLRGKAHWPSSALISGVTVLAMNLFFGQLLRVPLPWGIFEAYAF